MSYKLEIKQEKENNRYKVIVNGKGVVYIDNLKELESALKNLKINTEDND